MQYVQQKHGWVIGGGHCCTFGVGQISTFHFQRSQQLTYFFDGGAPGSCDGIDSKDKTNIERQFIALVFAARNVLGVTHHFEITRSDGHDFVAQQWWTNDIIGNGF
jgi:hypothetical protein